MIKVRMGNNVSRDAFSVDDIFIRVFKRKEISMNKNLLVVLSFFAITTFADEAKLPEIAPVDELVVPALEADVSSDVIQVTGEIEAAQGLTVVTDCGDCKVDDVIIQLLKDTYIKKASATALPLTYTIKEYQSRTTGARIAFGALAGKDKIKGTAIYEGGSKEVGDSAITIVCGTECVAKNVGEALAGLQK